jgi:acetyl esterase
MLHAALDATGIICVGQFPAHRPGSHERCCTAAARWICGTEAASGRGGRAAARPRHHSGTVPAQMLAYAATRQQRPLVATLRGGAVRALACTPLASCHPTPRRGMATSTMKSDPRMNPTITAFFEPFGLADEPEPCPVSPQSSMDDIQAWSTEAEAGFKGLFEVLGPNNPPLAGEVERSTEVIKGVDGNDINLYIHKPKGVTGPLPCIYHTHGGGMAILHAADANYVYWRDRLALEDLVVVGVEFRNCAGADGHNAFPAGLNDCASGLYWTMENKASLGIGNIVVSGESGGGNLAIATTMKAKVDGRMDQVSGTYTLCPYIAGDLHYSNPPPELPSLVENDGIFLSTGMLATLATPYAGADDKKNPLAWPLYSSADDLAGLPPTVISVNECDPLRDEGVVFGQKLVAAGVVSTTLNIMGTNHGADSECDHHALTSSLWRCCAVHTRLPKTLMVTRSHLPRTYNG